MPTRTKNIVATVTQLFETGKGSDIAGVRGTYWGAYNALTEYLNYSKGRNENNRMDSLWFGQNKTMSQKALDTALELTALWFSLVSPCIGLGRCGAFFMD